MENSYDSYDKNKLQKSKSVIMKLQSKNKEL